MTVSDERAHKRAANARAGRAVRRNPYDVAAQNRFAATRTELHEATIADFIREQIAKEPPLSAGQRHRLALLFASPEQSEPMQRAA